MNATTQATIVGTLARDPEIRYTRAGHACTSLAVEVTTTMQPDQGSVTSSSTFDVIAWRDLAENIALSLVKGSAVVVTGRLVVHTWEPDPEVTDGLTRSKVELVADDVAVSLQHATVDIHRVQSREDAVTAERERRENGEYDSLTDRERGAYDYRGQAGGSHDECMQAARTI